METDRRLECYVELKRKSYWVKRYAVLSKNFVFYKKKQSDEKQRRIINLYGCKIARGKRYTGQTFIHILKPSDPNFEDLKLCFFDQKTYGAWLEALLSVVQNYNQRAFGRLSQKRLPTAPMNSTLSTLPTFNPTQYAVMPSSTLSKSEKSEGRFSSPSPLRMNPEKKNERLADLIYQNAEKTYFQENTSQKRKQLIIRKIEEYQDKRYILADCSSEALLLISPQSESDIPIYSGMRYPPRHPQVTSRSVINIVKKCRFFFFSFLILFLSIAISYFTELYLQLVVAFSFPALFLLLLFVYKSIRDQKLQQVYDPLPYNEAYSYKFEVSLPAFCDILETICNVETLREKWLPFLKEYNPASRTLYYTLSPVQQLESTLTVFRFKDQRNFIIYEQELVERIFQVTPMKNETRLVIYGNSETFYLNDFRVNFLKIYTALTVIAKMKTGERVQALGGGPRMIEEDQREFEEEIDYAQNGPDDKSDIGNLTESMVLSENVENSNQKDDLEIFKSFDNNIPIRNSEMKEPEQTNGIREDLGLREREEEQKEESKEVPFEVLVSQIQNRAHQDYIRKARSKMHEMMEVMEMPDWKELSSKDGVTVYTKLMEKNIKAVRGIGEMPFPAQLVSCTDRQICDYLHDENEHLKYDTNFKEGAQIEPLPLDTIVSHQKYKGRTFISGRDFCLLSQTWHRDDGEIVITATSCQHSKCPPMKGLVRAECYIGGWRLKPLRKNLTHATYMSWVRKTIRNQSNLKGNLPQSLVNGVTKEQGYMINDIKRTMAAKYS